MRKGGPRAALVDFGISPIGSVVRRLSPWPFSDREGYLAMVPAARDCIIGDNQTSQPWQPVFSGVGRPAGFFILRRHLAYSPGLASPCFH